MGPTFVLPYKRYAADSLVQLSRHYVDRDHTTYERVARDDRNIRRAYVTPAPAPTIDERRFQRSTVWRWLSYLGSLHIALAHGLQLWQEHDGSSGLYRCAGPVAPHKHRSEHRAETLRTARRLLQLIDRWDRTFPEKFFPRFATKARVP